MITEDELTRAIDLKHNIVRVALTNGSKKAYRIPDLKTKTVAQTLQAILDAPNCPLHGQVGIKLYEYSLSDLFANQLEPQELIPAVLRRWESAKKKVVYDLLLKKETEKESDFSNRLAIPLTRNITEFKHQIKRSASSLVNKKTNKAANTTRFLIQSMEPFVDETRCIYKLQNDKSNSESRTSMPLSQFLQVESQKQGFSMDDPEIIQIRQHQQLLVTWVNLQLTEKSMHISDLHKDIRDGVALINLLEILTTCSIREYHKQPSSVQQKLQNCDLFLQFLNKLDIKSEVQPVEIFNGHMSALFGILYVLIKRLKEKKIIRDRRGKERLISVDLNKEKSTSDTKDTKLSLSQMPSAHPQTERISRENSPDPKKRHSFSCTDLEEKIQALDNREKLSIEEILKLRKPSSTTSLAKSTDNEIEQMINKFQGQTESEIEETFPSSGNESILDDILQTAKRLKEMKITRAPVIQKTKNINLSELNDDELEALLNDGNYDLQPLSLEFEDTKFDRDNLSTIAEIDSFLAEMEVKRTDTNHGTRNNNSKDKEEYDLDSLTFNVSNELLDSDINLDDL